AGELAQLVDRERDLGARLGEHRRGALGVLARVELRAAKPDHERREPLRRAVSPASTSRSRDAPRRPAKRSRSETTAARQSAESAETAMYSCVLSTLRVIDSNENGPS